MRFVELERGTPEQGRGPCFMTTKSMRIPAVCVSDQLAALVDQLPCLGQVRRIGLTGMHFGCGGKQCETDGENAAACNAGHSYFFLRG